MSRRIVAVFCFIAVAVLTVFVSFSGNGGSNFSVANRKVKVIHATPLPQQQSVDYPEQTQHAASSANLNHQPQQEQEPTTLPSPTVALARREQRAAKERGTPKLRRAKKVAIDDDSAASVAESGGSKQQQQQFGTEDSVASQEEAEYRSGETEITPPGTKSTAKQKQPQSNSTISWADITDGTKTDTSDENSVGFGSEDGNLQQGKNGQPVVSLGHANPHSISNNQSVDFCGYLDELHQKYYIVVPPKDIDSQSVADKATLAAPELLRNYKKRFLSPSLPKEEIWPSHDAVEKQKQRFEARPKPLFPVNADEIILRRVERCGGASNVSALVGFAANIEEKTTTFLRSFQKFAGPCSVLHLFVLNAAPIMKAFIPEMDNIIIEPYDKYTEEVDEKHMTEHQRVENQRVPTLQAWLLKHVFVYGRVVHADTKDVVFMSEPFDSFKKNYNKEKIAEEAQKDSGFVFAMWEEYALEKEARFPFNYIWTSAMGGPKLANLLESSVRLKGFPQFLYAMNSGIYGGTILALIDFLEVFTVTMLRVPVNDFGYDQGAMNVVVFFGLEYVKFPHNFIIMNPNVGPYRHMYFMFGGFNHIRYGPGMAHFNCIDEPYALVHQLNRHLKMWKMITNKHENFIHNFCLCQESVLSDKQPTTIVREDMRQRQGREVRVLDGKRTRKLLQNASFDVFGDRGPFSELKNMKWADGGDNSSLCAKMTGGPALTANCSRNRAVVAWINPNENFNLYLPFLQSFIVNANEEECPSTLHLLGYPRRRLIYDRVANTRRGSRRVIFYQSIAQWATKEFERQKVVNTGDSQDSQYITAIIAFRRFLCLYGHNFATVVFTSFASRSVWMNAPFPKSIFSRIDSEGPSHVFAVREPWWFGDDNKQATESVQSLFVSAVASESVARVLSEKLSLEGGEEFPFPLISYKLFGGTPTAVSDLLLAIMKMVQSPAFSISATNSAATVADVHAIVPALFAFGLAAASFPHTVILLDESAGPYRSMYRDGSSSVRAVGGGWESGIHLNCHDEPYSLVVSIEGGGGALWHYASQKYFPHDDGDGGRRKSKKSSGLAGSVKSLGPLKRTGTRTGVRKRSVRIAG